jgi:hypothetical protein
MADPLMELFQAIEAKKRKEDADLQDIADSIGHNGGPPIEEPFGIKAKWLAFAEMVELRRLAILNVRIERKKSSLKSLTDERRTIMMRCIRRMRRKDGKQ